MCQAKVHLVRNGQEEEVMRDVILLESSTDGLRLTTFFEEPKVVRATIAKIDFLKHIVTLVEGEGKAE